MINKDKLIEDIKNAGDLIPSEYDGSYELVQSIVGEYSKMAPDAYVDHRDLEAIYHCCIGTWRQDFGKKKESIASSHLLEESKKSLSNLMDEIWDNACHKKYQHHTENGKFPAVGMFGTGFWSFHNTGEEEVRKLITMFVDVSKLDDDEIIYNLVHKEIKDGVTGMGAASLSVILHCLKPYTFAIINGNYTGEIIFPLLGIKLNKYKDVKYYIDNCRAIKEFRDNNIGRINYRVVDVFSMKLDEYRINRIDSKKLDQAISGYINRFPKNLEEETYKWQALKIFQDNFDIAAKDFSEMFLKATSKAGNLLSGSYYLPRAIMKNMIEYNAEYVRQMFSNLMDETQPVPERIEQFKEQADQLYEKMSPGSKYPHHQSYRAITTYLFFIYPEKYGIFMPQKFEIVANYLGYGDLSKQGSLSRVAEYFDMLNQIWKEIQNKNELISLSRTRIKDDCYKDENNHVLAEDLIYYMFRFCRTGDDQIIPDKPDDEYWPSYEEYPMDLTPEDWKRFLTEIEIPNHPMTIQMLKGMMELGGEASCKQLSNEYGGNPTSYVGRAVNIGRRAKKYFNLPAAMDEGKERYFPIPFQGKSVLINGENQYVYRIREELKEALNGVDLSNIDPHYTVINEPAKDCRYWLCAPGRNASEWQECVDQGVMLLGWGEIGDLSQYESRDQIIQAMKDIFGDTSTYWMDSFATWQFSHVIKPGDVIFAKKGRSKIIGRGIVTSEYYFDAERDEFPNVIDVKWTDIGEWTYPGLLQVKTLTEVVKHSEYLSKINELFEGGGDKYEEYTDEDFLKEVFVTKEKLSEMKDLLQIKKNIILQGAPGVGKTFSAKRLAYTMMGVKDDSRIEFIQFHQNYSYEDFIMGYKPDENGGFIMQEGVFYNFCKEAEDDPENDYFFIIDEINRGNMSKIFGELLMAIEADYRTETVKLAYCNIKFHVPEKLHLIGMMNTADRSLAMIDYALRRRFSFVSMSPGFDSEGFKEYQKPLHNELFDHLITVVISLNEDIKKDESLGEGFCIGHSYFCGMKKEDCTLSRLQQIVKYDLIPTLEEYWFDNKEKLRSWKQKLQDAIK